MSGHRCFVEHSRWNTSRIELGAEESHYLIHVLRVNSNTKIKFFDGEGHEAEGRVVIEGKKVWLEEPNIIRNEPPPEVKLCLAIAVLKGQKMDFVVEKATEIGASKIIPFVSEYTVKRPASSESVINRWKKIALNATRQCNGVWLPEIHPVLDYKSAVDYCQKSSLFLIATLACSGKPLREVINQYKKRDIKSQSVILMIGPEGDFTSEEIHLAINHGAIAVNFGKRILRAETAALYGLSVLQYSEIAG